MVFVVRLRSSAGMKRLLFPSDESSFLDLQHQIADLIQVDLPQQKLSRDPIGANPKASSFIQAAPASTLAQLKINNGDILYIDQHKDVKQNNSTASDSTSASFSSSAAASAASSSSASSSTSSVRSLLSSSSRLTPRCDHGPRGGCSHCLGAPPGVSKFEVDCNHGSNATCIHCSKYVADKNKDPAAWLCNHPETVFCPKCLPPDNSVDDEKKSVSRCSCDASKGQECIHCVSKPSTIKVDKIPFQRWLDETKSLCHFKHSSNMTCAFCAPPPFPSFAAKPHCDRGHAPWPAGVCLACAPPNASLKEQRYRHCDTICIEARILQPFHQAWLRSSPEKPKAALLFGRYVPEPAETNNPGAIRALVYCLYEPPQESSPAIGGVRFLKDDKEKLVHEIASRLGLEAVGWVVVTLPRAAEHYGGKVFMSGVEVQQAARFQSRYKNELGYSKFVSVIVEHGEQVEPNAYQVADVAVALERDGVLAKADDPNLLTTKVPKAGEQVATVVYKDRPLIPGQQFLPDDLVVKVIVSSPKLSDPILQYQEFPSNGTEAAIRSQLRQHAKEDYSTRLSDFNLLVALARVIPTALVLEVIDVIKSKGQVKADLKNQLDRALTDKKLI